MTLEWQAVREEPLLREEYFPQRVSQGRVLRQHVEISKTGRGWGVRTKAAWRGLLEDEVRQDRYRRLGTDLESPETVGET